MTTDELRKSIQHRLEQTGKLEYVWLPKDWIRQLLAVSDTVTTDTNRLTQIRDIARCLHERLEADNGDLSAYDYHRDTGRSLSEDIQKLEDLTALITPTDQ